ncbi:methyl-accepting chemotaxis protein [Cellulosilyticum lentocellum]|uniref:Methyl-accepting chemotaxis sensory transducer with Cache sensor n=1 Tax=Cellulosilyticum lentocellum (strain ATCC 49066 / DSM 5427 / NCIMB 11756 / RHM5) TaxID=642492 RepID=F2JM16_CELLD|nr:methyl-accepting chemotaxis protein [Cellulosilyticum lentocellum]ADZ85796.1 methyl-accepting chemotaxis sensory transducer with Cache sensor [Cellulosilyticum lentocellum DSM 5427]
MKTQITKQQMKEKQTTIRKKLMLMIIPIMVLALSMLGAISIFNIRSVMLDDTYRSLREQAVANANKISAWVQGVFGNLNSVQSSLENIDFKSDEEELKYLASTLELHQAFPNGIYGGDETGIYLDGSGWVPDADFVVTERPWYKEGLTHEKFTFGEPYLDDNTKGFIVSATTKIKREDKKNFVASADVSLNDVTSIVANINIMDTDSGYGFLVDQQNNMILGHKNSEWNAKMISTSDESSFMAEVAGYIQEEDFKLHTIKDEGKDYFVMVEPIEGTTWRLVTCVARNEIVAVLYKVTGVYLILALIFIIIISVIVMKVINSMMEPVGILTEGLTRITEGDFTVMIDTKSHDEIGRMSEALKKYIIYMKKLINDIKLISSELDQNADTGKESALFLNQMAEGQYEAMNNTHKTVEELVKSVTEVAEHATSLAQIVGVTNEHSNEADDKMNHTVRATAEGQQDMNKVRQMMDVIIVTMGTLIESVEEVNTSTGKINEIIKFIEDMASQTNLLSLNASIEAARAGEAGKGFSVVAQEIGKLAEMSANSTKEISEIISGVQEQVGAMVEKTKDSASIVEENKSSINKAYSTFEKIYSEITEASKLVANIKDTITQVDEVATSMAAISEEQSASAEEILSTIEMMTGRSKRFNEESEKVEKTATIAASSSVTLVEYMNKFKLD